MGVYGIADTNTLTTACTLLDILDQMFYAIPTTVSPPTQERRLLLSTGTPPALFR